MDFLPIGESLHVMGNRRKDCHRLHRRMSTLSSDRMETLNQGKMIWQDIQRVRAERPLVHNITNYVVMNTTANALLAIGASPVMAHAIEEVGEMVSLAGALVINIGTLSAPWVKAMVKAGK